MRKVRSTRKTRARQVFTRMSAWDGNKYQVHRKTKVRRPHEKTSALKMRFLDTVIAPVMRISERKTLVRNLTQPGPASGWRKKM
jgi:hypothetical protein